MTTYIAFLRGINVGAHNRMKMDDLRATCESLGFDAVRTYIQSGNVVFETAAADVGSLAADLRAAIEEEFGYDVVVMVRTRDELDAVVANQPFDDPADESVKRYVTFLAETPATERVDALMAAEHEAETFAVRDREVYSQVRKDEQKSGRFTDVGAALGTDATRRTWNVVTKVHELASA